MHSWRLPQHQTSRLQVPAVDRVEVWVRVDPARACCRADVAKVLVNMADRVSRMAKPRARVCCRTEEAKVWARESLKKIFIRSSINISINTVTVMALAVAWVQDMDLRQSMILG